MLSSVRFLDYFPIIITINNKVMIKESANLAPSRMLRQTNSIFRDY